MMSSPVLLAICFGRSRVKAWKLDICGNVISETFRPIPDGGVASNIELVHEISDCLDPPDVGARLPSIVCGAYDSIENCVEDNSCSFPVSINELGQKLDSVSGVVREIRIIPKILCVNDRGHEIISSDESAIAFGLLSKFPQYAIGQRIVCYPGFETKWMLVQDGSLKTLVTAMSGEVLSAFQRREADPVLNLLSDAKAFQDGLAAAGDGDDLILRLSTFAGRQEAAGGNDVGALSYLAGLLIGADVVASPRLLPCELGQEVFILEDAPFSALYAQALQNCGVEVVLIDRTSSTLAGLFAVAINGGLL